MPAQEINYIDPNGPDPSDRDLWLELAGLEGRVTAVELITPLVRQPNYVAALGDSIVAGDGDPANGTLGGNSWFTWLCLYSDGALVPVRHGNAGIGGETATQIAARVDDIIALTPTPSRCFVMAGTNNCNGTFNLTTYSATMIGLYDELREANIEPIIMLLPPKTSFPDEVSEANAWLSGYGATQGIQVIDVYSPFIDASDGSWQSGYADDGTHPNIDGASALGLVAWNAVKDRIQPANRPVLTSYASDAANLIANGVFVGDTNGDGTANGWSEDTGNAGARDSLVSGGNDVPGNWQTLDLAGSSVLAYFTQVISTGWSVGDVVLFAGRIKTVDMDEPDERVQIRIVFDGGSMNMGYVNLYKAIDATNGQVFSIVGTVPAGTTSIQPQLLCNADAGVGVISFAQITLRNLTTLGLA